MRGQRGRFGVVVAAAAAVAVATFGPAGAGVARADTTPPAIGHVWQIELENESASVTFGPGSPATYLNGTLVPEGVFLPNYYATGHESNDNYIAEVSGQLGNAENFSDCQFYDNFVGTITAQGVPAGAGCVYPSSILTLADQLTAAGLTWRGYMEDMGNNPDRETATCGQPTAPGPTGAQTEAPADPAAVPPVRDDTQTATAADQYAARHNPFIYFHSLIDVPTGATASPCQTNVVPLGTPTSATGLAADLSSGKVADWNWITPNLCNDGHDGGTTTSPTCAGPDASGADPGPGGLTSADRFLQLWVPKIMASAAYRQNGLIVITFDEAATSDTSSCCNETGVAGVQPVGGGGRIGALLLSPLLTPHTSTCDYNHFALLRSLEDIYGITTGGSDGEGHLAQAGKAGVSAFGPDVYGPTDTCAPASSAPEVSEPSILLAIGVAAVAAVVVLGRRRRHPRRPEPSGLA